MGAPREEERPAAEEGGEDHAREDAPAQAIGRARELRIDGAHRQAPEAQVFEDLAHLHRHVVAGLGELAHAAQELVAQALR